ncbi:MAG: hypothetical protein WBA51_18905 [Erythrobacter sp.]
MTPMMTPLMAMTGSRRRQIGWSAVLAVCITAFIVLSVTVHAVRNEVVLKDRQILALKKKKQRLETEFQARASQHQLALWNNVDLGYTAPRADQYLETRRDLAAFGQPVGPNAPSPIRVARLDAGSSDTAPDAVPATRPMVSPVSGEPITLAALDNQETAGTAFAEAFGDMLIEASPIRQAKAQTTRASYTPEVAE